MKSAVKDAFPEAISDIKLMGSLSTIEQRATKELRDVDRYPEVAKVAEVRRGLELCDGEKAFLASRKLHVREHFAEYIGVVPEAVHPDDIPIVSFGGSGGGFRAMIGFLGYCNEMKRAGLWDVLTYAAGVSGSCWSLASYYTFGDRDWDKVVEHCKTRLSPHHPLSGEAIRSVLTAPGGADVTLGPLVQKRHSGLHTVAMDLYSVFTTGYVFLQGDPSQQPGGSAGKEVAGYHRDWFKWSNALKWLEGGAEPLPLLTAIRHERPWRDWADGEHPFKEPDHAVGDHATAEDAWFQWVSVFPESVARFLTFSLV